MSDDSLHARWQASWAGIAAAGVIVAAAAQPLLRYMDPSLLLGGALVFGIGVALLYEAGRTTDRYFFSAALVCALLGLGIGVTALYAAQSLARTDSDSNDRRCLAIQRDMLSAHPRKPDGAALFQAFGCRPQGEGSVMVPPTTAELALKRKRVH